MVRSLSRPKILTTFPDKSLLTKIQTLNLQSIPNHDLNNRTDNCYGNFNSESFYTSLLDRSTSKRHLNQLYSRIIVTGFQYNGFIVTKFIHISSNLGEISFARKLFDEFPEPYVFLWNAIIRGYSKQNMFNEAITLYTQMQNVGIGPDCFTLPHVLKACGGAAVFEVGRAVHGQIFRRGFESDVFVQNGVVSLYAKCGRIDNARTVFEGLSDRTIVSWTSIISAYAQNGQPIEALRIFKTMRNYDT
ncbi:hypothetical protein L1887_30286 [Cichorium endivia]|nr:hypothetical protein L1887_30286 [Cichorium endivia]